jgi:hypothetical protein
MRHVSRLGLALALTLGLLSTPAFAGDVEGALKYVPANFTTVVAVDFDAVRKSPFFDMATAMLDKNKGAKSIEHELGLDAKKDLKTFVLAGPEAFMHHEEQFVVIIDAKIDGDKLIAYVKSQSGSVTEKKVGAASVYVVDKEGAFAVDGKFVIAGYAPLVEQALAAKAGKSVGSGPLASLVKRFKGSKGGFAISGGGPKVRSMMSADMPEFDKLQSAGAGLDLSSGATLTLVGNFADAGAASTISDGIGSALQDASTDPDLKEMGLASMVAKIKTTAKGKAVEIGFKLDAAEAKQLIETFAKMQ